MSISNRKVFTEILYLTEKSISKRKVDTKSLYLTEKSNRSDYI